MVVETYMKLHSLKQEEEGVMSRLQVLMINTYNVAVASEISEQSRAELSWGDERRLMERTHTEVALYIQRPDRGI